jgi:hypothetical protein
MTRFSLIVAWLVATGLATVIAWQVVGAADDQISDAPMTPLVGVTTSARHEALLQHDVAHSVRPSANARLATLGDPRCRSRCAG